MKRPQNGTKSKAEAIMLFILWSVLALIVVLAIVIPIIVWASDEENEYENDDNWDVGFSTGVSLITSYAVETTIRSRLSTTQITMEVANALDCSSVHVVTLQLPVQSRVTSLQTTGSDGCTSYGKVQEIQEAKETFEEQVEMGLPGSFVEALNDAFSYSVQVSIPPLGKTSVTLVVEQILQQQLGEVAFAIPWIPNEDVDKVLLDLSVEDISGNPADFEVALDTNILINGGSGVTRAPTEAPTVTPTASPVNSTTANPTRRPTQSPTKRNSDPTEAPTVTPVLTTFTGSLRLELPDARQYRLPKVVRGKYNPGGLPPTGALFADDKCFEHFFVPPSQEESMARNLLFLVDSSLEHEFKQVMAALIKLIDTLSPQDTFTIQTFGRTGTIKLWGSAFGTESEKQEAIAFVNLLKNDYTSQINLNEAFLEGLLRAKTAAETYPDAATVMFVISGGYAGTGEQSRSKIAKHVYELNKEQKVKIFTMGLADYADMELLDAIALMNGGLSMPLGDMGRGGITTAEQIVNFFESQIGNILLSDVNVDLSISGGTVDAGRVYGMTEQSFSLISSGYEVAVRGLLEISKDENTLDLEDIFLFASTSAATLTGDNEWEASTALQANINDNDASLCFQSYAHARVTQLMRLYEASKFIDHDIVMELVTLADPELCDDDEKTTMVDCIKAEALALALQANLVAKGLTAMVTTVQDEEMCKLNSDNEVCLDGTTPGDDDLFYSIEDGYRRKNDYRRSSAQGQSYGAFPFVFVVWLIVAILFGW